GPARSRVGRACRRARKSSAAHHVVLMREEVYSGASVHGREGQSLPPGLDAARKRKRATGTDEDMLDPSLMREPGVRAFQRPAVTMVRPGTAQRHSGRIMGGSDPFHGKLAA